MWALCKKRMPRGTANTHTITCESRSEFCPHCSEVLRGNAAVVKHVAVCAAAPSPCPNAGCDANVAQDGMDAHRAVCAFELVPCEVPGCTVKMARNALDAHMTTAAGAHFKALSSTVLALTARLEAAEAELRRYSAEAEAVAPKEGGGKRAKR